MNWYKEWQELRFWIGLAAYFIAMYFWMEFFVNVCGFNEEYAFIPAIFASAFTLVPLGLLYEGAVEKLKRRAAPDHLQCMMCRAAMGRFELAISAEDYNVEFVTYRCQYGHYWHHPKADLKK